MTDAPTIPTPEQYAAAGDQLSAAIATLEMIAVDLRQIVDEEGELREGAPRPRLADVGALFSLTDDITTQADHLGHVAEELGRLLVLLNLTTLRATAEKASAS